jgi:hypothetical protein
MILHLMIGNRQFINQLFYYVQFHVIYLTFLLMVQLIEKSFLARVTNAGVWDFLLF